MILIDDQCIYLNSSHWTIGRDLRWPAVMLCLALGASHVGEETAATQLLNHQAKCVILALLTSLFRL